MNNAASKILNVFRLMLRGELLLHLNIGKYFVHIIYTFFLFGIIIWVSLRIDGAMARVEDNKKIIKELEIIHTQKTFDVVSLSRRSSVEKMLKEMGSTVGEPGQPATILRK